MRKILFCLLSLSLSIAAVGCGGSDLDEASQKDVAKAVNSVIGGAVSSVLSGMGSSSGLRSGKSYMRITGANKLTRKGFETSEPNFYAFDSCPTDSQEGCTSSCNDALTSITTSCTIDKDQTFVCGEDEYTVSDQSMEMTMDFSKFDVDTTTGAVSGTLGLDLDMSAKVDGGELKGGKLECKIGLTVDIEKAAAGQDTAPEIDCDNFSCTYDGNEISCEDMKTQADDNSCGEKSGVKDDTSTDTSTSAT